MMNDAWSSGRSGAKPCPPLLVEALTEHVVPAAGVNAVDDVEAERRVGMRARLDEIFARPDFADPVRGIGFQRLQQAADARSRVAVSFASFR